MSEYLMRLATRGREASEAQFMQPSVRTSSPVAEHDQRIGRTSFEGFDSGEASPGAEGAEAGAEQGHMLQPPAPFSAMTAGEAGRATIQRKMADPPASMVGSGTFTARGEAPAAESQTPDRAQSPGSGAGAPDLADAHDVSLSPLDPPIRSPASSIGGIHPEALSPGDPQTGSASRQFDPGAVHTRSIRQTRQVDSPRIEPSPSALAGHFKPPIERAGEPSSDAHEGPHVIIGRINVEVVPPPAAPTSTAASRPGPMTAASASVIGPLSGGIRPSLRLSLRHR